MSQLQSPPALSHIRAELGEGPVIETIGAQATSSFTIEQQIDRERSISASASEDTSDISSRM